MPSGILYIIASPIGNMGDITFRAIEILKEKVHSIYCEDTRQTRKLLARYGISGTPQSLHAHSSDKKITHITDSILGGRSVAYLTDSGTPGISDPGSRLVRQAREKGIQISPVPGPSALTAILSVSGFTGKNIIFAGFLSKKDGKRQKELISLREFDGTIVIYESPYRIKKLLSAISNIFPYSEVLIGREMTKLFEEFIFTEGHKIPDIVDTITEKGEFSVVICNIQN